MTALTKTQIRKMPTMLRRAHDEYLISTHRLRDSVSQLLLYTDPSGKKGTSAGGLVTQINKKKKALLGPVELYDESRYHANVSINMRIESAIRNGQRQNLLRPEIKRNIYASIYINP